MSIEVDQYLEKLDSTHIVLFHEGGKETKDTEFNFIKKDSTKMNTAFTQHKNPKKFLMR